MKFLQSVVVFFVCLNLSSCRHNGQEVTIVSPTGDIVVVTAINKDESKPDYMIVKLHVYDRTGNELYTIDSNASHFHKWAIGWSKTEDTLIMYSSDIGTYAWTLEEEGYTNVKVSKTIKELANSFYEKKYGKAPRQY